MAILSSPRAFAPGVWKNTKGSELPLVMLWWPGPNGKHLSLLHGPLTYFTLPGLCSFYGLKAQQCGLFVGVLPEVVEIQVFQYRLSNVMILIGQKWAFQHTVG